MDPPSLSSLPDRSRIIPPINSDRSAAEATKDLTSDPDTTVASPSQIYLPPSPKLWPTDRIVYDPDHVQKDRNAYNASQWLHLRINPEAAIDDTSTPEGKLWNYALQALVAWKREIPHACIMMHWGRVVEKERRERGEVVMICSLNSGHVLNAFVKSQEYADFWRTVAPLLSAPPKAFYVCADDSDWGLISVTDVFFPKDLSQTTRDAALNCRRHYFLVPRRQKATLQDSRSAWIEDDTLEWRGQKALCVRYVCVWKGAEEEEEFKQKAVANIIRGNTLIEERFWQGLNDLGMLGFEEYHCVLSYVMYRRPFQN